MAHLLKYRWTRDDRFARTMDAKAFASIVHRSYAKPSVRSFSLNILLFQVAIWGTT